MSLDDFNKDDIEEGPLPGFRFHPTDEELVSFYLRRKLAKKTISLDLIKQVDIYKYEPWDLTKICSSNGEKEWYFFCKRGRKYKNSVRPNRVTGSGFWKATGIDKPIYSHGGEGKESIGLKKTLVYYRGSAGKGTKTDWMMHEFRLPSKNDNNITKNNETTAPEAEIWTLCRILKRNVSQRKQFTSDVKQLAANKRISTDQKLNKMRCVDGNLNQEAYNISFESNFGHIYSDVKQLAANKRISTDQKLNKMRCVDGNLNQEAYNISFESNFGHIYNNDKSVIIDNNTKNDQMLLQFQSPMAQQQQAQLLTTTPTSNLWISPIVNDLFKFENWDELASVVKFAYDTPMIFE